MEPTGRPWKANWKQFLPKDENEDQDQQNQRTNHQDQQNKEVKGQDQQYKDQDEQQFKINTVPDVDVQDLANEETNDQTKDNVKKTLEKPNLSEDEDNWLDDE